MRSLDAIIFAAVNGWAYLFRRRLIRSFFAMLDYWPEVAQPKTFAEKILWRKLFERNPVFAILSDKLAARPWMAARAPELRVARTLWAGDRAADIPNAVLAGGVMLKTNHGSASNIILKQAPADRREIETRMESWRALRLETLHGEWGYGLVPGKIFAEELLPNDDAEPLLDFNFFCCEGEVLFYVLTLGEKTPEEAVAFYRADGSRDFEADDLPDYPKRFLPRDYCLPAKAKEALNAAARISRGLDFLRIDIMLAGGQLYAAETTLYPCAGYGIYTRLALVQGAMEAWDLRKSWFLTTPQSGLKALYAGALKRSLARDRAPAGTTSIQARWA